MRADFTRALYLGMTHGQASLPRWSALTLGQPAVLHETPTADWVCQHLANLQGAAQAVLLPSTLHLFWDLLSQLAQERPTVLLLDGGAYPILQWCARGAQARSVRSFPHHDPYALQSQLLAAQRQGFRPVVVCDGFCPGCNAAAPLAEYARQVAMADGLLVVDDTQALGILGGHPSADCPYGHGGGGTPRWLAASGPRVLIGASLAKALGAPLAALSGGLSRMRQFAQRSLTRLHCSPPSAVATLAAQAALTQLARAGEGMRATLLARVQRLRAQLMHFGLEAVGNLPMPVQSFRLRKASQLQALWRRLLAGGVRCLLTQGCGRSTPQLSLLVTTRHTPAQIDHVAQVLTGRDRPCREGDWT